MKKTAYAILLLIGFASAPSFAETRPADPYEGYNRAVSRFNDQADRYIFAPVARGYRKVTPQPVRTGISNFFNNLRDVVSFGSNILRLDIKRASEDLVRIGINTTFGLGGLIDIAGAGGIPDNKNTLGDTFATWGWKNSNYFVIPVFGPSTVRDALGTGITTVYPPKNIVFHTPAGRWGTTAASAVNTREGLLDLTDGLDDAAIDKYSYTRDLYMKVRARQTGAAPVENPEENIDIDELVESSETGAAETAVQEDSVSETQAEAAGEAETQPGTQP